MSREIMQQALSAFEAIMFEKDAESCQIIAKNARYGLREELAKPEQPELRKAAEMAIPLLVAYQDYTGDSRIANKCGKAIEALRQALWQESKHDNQHS